MLVIGIICLVVAAISYFKYLSEKNGQANQKQAENKNEAKWQRTLAIIFLAVSYTHLTLPTICSV